MTTFASPNALSAFNRMGFNEELEGESLAEVTTQILPGKQVIDESLPLVVTGRAPWRTDIEARGVTVSLRTIPLRDRGNRIGAINPAIRQGQTAMWLANRLKARR